MPRVLDYSDIDKDPEYEDALARYVAQNPDSPDALKQRMLSRPPGRPAVTPSEQDDVAPDRPAVGPPAPMAQPAAALASMSQGASMPDRADQIGRAIAEGRDLTPFITPPSADARPTPTARPMADALSALQTIPGPDARAMAVERPGSMDAALTSLQTRPGADVRPSPRQLPTGQGGPLNIPPTPQGEAMFADLQRAGRASQEPAGAPDPDLPDVAMPGLPPTPGPATPLGKTVQVGYAAKVPVQNTAVMRSALSAPIAPGEGKPPPGPLPAEHPAVAKGLEEARSAVKVAPDTAGGDLDAALRQSADRRLLAGLTRAGGAMIGRGSGPGYDALDAEADRPLQEMQLRRADASRREEDDPSSATSQTYRAVMARLSPDLAKQPGWETKTAAQLKSMFPVVEKLASIEATKGEKSATLEREKGRDAETVRHDKAMEARHAAVAVGAGGLSKQAAKELAVLQRSWDPSGPRSGERGKNQARVNAAGRIEALAGQGADLNPQQMTELARQLDTLLSNGGQATEGVTRALTAHTATGKVADILQWWTSEPHGAGQQAFVQQMLETARREKAVSGQQLRDSYVQTLPSVPTLMKERPDVIQNMLRAQGVDPSGIDLGTGLARPSISPAAETGGPKRISSDAEYDALPSGAEYISPDGKHRRKR